jgi:site-specific recombinase XerC
MRRTLIHSLRDSDVRALLVAAGQGPFGDRDTAVLLVMLDSGMRLSGLVGLQVGSVDFENGYCQVMGKGFKERRVPLSGARRAVQCVACCSLAAEWRSASRCSSPTAVSPGRDPSPA